MTGQADKVDCETVRKEPTMTDRQLQLIMQIVREQLSDYLAEPLVNDIAEGISLGISDNMETLNLLANMD